MPTVTSRRDLLRLLAAVGISGSQASAAIAQSGKVDDSVGGKIIFENEKVKVISHVGRPRMGVCGTGLHSHPPHLTIALSDARARVTLPGKEPFIDEAKAGAAFWDPGGPHIVENIGSRDTKVYLVELKA